MHSRPFGALFIGLWFAGWATHGSSLVAEEPPAEPVPAEGAIGTAVVSFELIGRGLVPTARIVITNPSPVKIQLPRTWTYEVIPQPAILDSRMRSTLPEVTDEQRFSVKDFSYMPEQRVWLTLSEQTLFGRSRHDEILIGPRRSWGHDHVLDLRPGNFKPGPVFIRFALGSSGPKSDWLRLLVPDVPAVPLLRFTTETRKLTGDVPFGRAVKEAGGSFIATADSGAHPWTRVLTLDPLDPLAAQLPRLLLDGRSQQVFADGVRCRFAVRGISATGEVEDDASVMAVQPVE